jgi:hypothetical protein
MGLQAGGLPVMATLGAYPSQAARNPRVGDGPSPPCDRPIRQTVWGIGLTLERPENRDKLDPETPSPKAAL